MTKQDREKIINQLKKALAKQPVKLAYLYGSYARGQETPKSDIDIAVMLEENSSKTNDQIAEEISLGFDPDHGKINIVSINENTSSLFLHSIFKTRIVLISKNEREKTSFEVMATKIYWDEEYRRKMLHHYYWKVRGENPYPLEATTQ